MSSDTTFNDIEKPAGPPDVEPRDGVAIDRWRRETYLSYESFLRGRLEQFDRSRPALWHRDYSSTEAYVASIAPQRRRLAEMLGFWIPPEQRAPVQTGPGEVLLEEPDYTARRFSLELFPGLTTYAVELVPAGPGPHPGLLAQHGYGGTPELVCGLTATSNGPDYTYRSMGLRAVARGYHVVAVHHPSGYGTPADAVSTLPDFAHLGSNYGKNRLHRLALMAGGTLFGLDMMASSRGVDVLLSRPDVDPGRIAMYGLSQGGESALFLPALDERIGASVSSAYFNHRMPKLIGGTRATCYVDSGEEDKFFSDVIRLFADSDIVSLIAPRAFAVEAGVLDGAVDFEKAQAEFDRAAVHYQKLGLVQRTEFIAHEEGHVCATRRAFEFLDEQLPPASVAPVKDDPTPA